MSNGKSKASMRLVDVLNSIDANTGHYGADVVDTDEGLRNALASGIAGLVEEMHHLEERIIRLERKEGRD